MKRYEFEVRSYHTPEYVESFYRIFDKEKAEGNLNYQHVIEETAPPPELIKDIVLVTAATLTVIKHLYDFYKETKPKRGKVYITIEGKTFDLEAYNIDELKAKISDSEKDTKQD